MDNNHLAKRDVSGPKFIINSEIRVDNKFGAIIKRIINHHLAKRDVVNFKLNYSGKFIIIPENQG